MEKPPRNNPSERQVTAQEKRLWKLVTQHDTPLHAPEGAPEDDTAIVTAELDVDAYAKTQASTPAAAPMPAPQSKPPSFHLLNAGEYAGVDANTAAKFKRGKLPIEYEVDLHGLSQLDAFDALQTAIEQAAAARQRVMLVITGKGRGGDGVLRENLPFWLNTTRLRPFVLAFDRATPKDGGTGAFYVLLKRSRQQNKDRT